LDLTLSSLIQKYLAKDAKDPIKEEGGEAKIEDKNQEEELLLASGSKV
jgi:hypothetical protein